MCGIVARRGAGPLPLAPAMAALAHRGPDGDGVLESAEASLGHVRLAIVDRAGGRQPIANETRTIHVVVNGEFYGDAAIRRELEGRGHRFRTGSDSEILLHLYEDHGLDALTRLRGEFAFVLWDAPRRRLVAGRDRFGVKPLVWTEHAGALLLASEAKALFALGVLARWDQDALARACRSQYPGLHQTLFAGIRQLPPGWILVDEPGSRILRRWWDMVPAAEAEILPDGPNLVDAVREAFREAVDVRLRGEVPVCVQLSGGLDSSAVAGRMSERLGPGVAAYSVVFDDPAWSEAPVIAGTVAAFGLDWRPVTMGPQQALDALPAAVRAGEGLAVNTHIAAKHLLNRAVAADGFKVALTGEGADELFLGYPHMREDVLSGDPAALAAMLAANAAYKGLFLGEGAEDEMAALERHLGCRPAWLKAKFALGARVSGLLRPDADLPRRDGVEEILADFDLATLVGRRPVDVSAVLWSRLCLAGYILRTLADGQEMAHGVEGRPPFLDDALHAIARRLPTSACIRDGVEKWVLRAAVAPWVTDAVRTRQKHPFMAPPLALVDDPAVRGRLLDSFACDRLRATPFDGPALRALVMRLPELPRAERLAWEPPLMMALSCLHLAESFRITA
jgi:asparagine synthase (glutamine-hydrolysing)